MPYPLSFVNTYFAEFRPFLPFCGKYTKSRDRSRQIKTETDRSVSF